MPVFDWLQPDNPLFYWYAYFIFGPLFFLGWWGLAAMVLLHLVVFSLLLWCRRKAARRQTWPRRLLGAVGLLVITNLLVGVLFYGTAWLLTNWPF